MLTYNLFRDHESVGGKPPGERAKVNAPFSSWIAVSVRWFNGADVPESVVATPAGGGFTFAVGERRFVYDRQGLRRG